MLILLTKALKADTWILSISNWKNLFCSDVYCLTLEWFREKTLLFSCIFVKYFELLEWRIKNRRLKKMTCNEKLINKKGTFIVQILNFLIIQLLMVKLLPQQVWIPDIAWPRARKLNSNFIENLIAHGLVASKARLDSRHSLTKSKKVEF